MFYHICQVAVTEIHGTFSSGVLPLQGRRLKGRKKKTWEAEALKGFNMELRSEKHGSEKAFLGRVHQLGKIERQCIIWLRKEKDNKHSELGPHVSFFLDSSPDYSILLKL